MKGVPVFMPVSDAKRSTSRSSVLVCVDPSLKRPSLVKSPVSTPSVSVPFSCLLFRHRWRVGGAIWGTTLDACQGSTRAHRPMVEEKRPSRMPYKRR
jgi:hypothetical protein